jgi:nucleoside 2-deoxyribosyltransferase
MTEFKVLPAGWAHLEELRKVSVNSEQCFVAMWFDEQMNKIYDEIITKAVLDAGYRPHRVDKREHNDQIDDEIIAQIRRSRFIVADFTGLRGGVYYEAGFAKGLGLEVVWTCRKDYIKDLHFDIRQYNCIVWEEDKLSDFMKRLTNRIESVLGRGKYVSDARA